MTVFVTEPTVRGDRMKKPQVVKHPYDEGDLLDYLVKQHEDCIYFTDDTTPWDRLQVTPGMGTSMLVTLNNGDTYSLREREPGVLSVVGQVGDIVVRPYTANRVDLSQEA